MQNLPDLSKAPIPQDDGACAHLVGEQLPQVKLTSTRGNQLDLSKRKEGELEQIPVEFEPLSQTLFGVLVVYRKAGVDTPVHVIVAEIWQGQEKVAIVPPVHCIGMVPSQVHQYVSKMLSVLEERYGIKKFASQTRLDPELCVVRPCPLHV